MSPPDEFQIMEHKDEQQILAELQGSFLKKFVYSFSVGKKKVTGISWAGIKEIAYRLKGIDTEIQKFEETETHYIFIVKATNKDVGSRLGVSNQPKMIGAKVDQFALQKALSKAQRNAIRGVIPEATIEMYLTEFTQKREQVDSFKPPKTKAALRKEVEAEFTEKSESDHGQNLPWDGDLSPANMQAYLTANGFDGPKFKFRDDESGMVVCDGAPWVDDFKVLQAVYREMGGEYVKAENKWVFRY